jgi:hypothetical protein
MVDERSARRSARPPTAAFISIACATDRSYFAPFS